MVSLPRGPKETVDEDPRALLESDIGAWLYPPRGYGIQIELRDEFPAWAKHRPAHLREMKAGHDLFHAFIEGCHKSTEGRIKLLRARRRQYQAAYELCLACPAGCQDKTLQMIRYLDNAITLELKSTS